MAKPQPIAHHRRGRSDEGGVGVADVDEGERARAADPADSQSRDGALERRRAAVARALAIGDAGGAAGAWLLVLIIDALRRRLGARDRADPSGGARVARARRACASPSITSRRSGRRRSSASARASSTSTSSIGSATRSRRSRSASCASIWSRARVRPRDRRGDGEGAGELRLRALRAVGVGPGRDARGAPARAHAARRWIEKQSRLERDPSSGRSATCRADRHQQHRVRALVRARARSAADTEIAASKDATFRRGNDAYFHGQLSGSGRRLRAGRRARRRLRRSLLQPRQRLPEDRAARPGHLQLRARARARSGAGRRALQPRRGARCRAQEGEDELVGAEAHAAVDAAGVQVDGGLAGLDVPRALRRAVRAAHRHCTSCSRASCASACGRASPSSASARASAARCSAGASISPIASSRRSCCPTRCRSKRAPTPNYQAVFGVHAGLRVRVTEKEQDWARIRLANGLEGWVRERDLAGCDDPSRATAGRAGDRRALRRRHAGRRARNARRARWNYAVFDRLDGDLLVGERDGAIVATLQLTMIQQLSARRRQVAPIEIVRVARALRSQGLGAVLIQDADRPLRRRLLPAFQLTSNQSRSDAALLRAPRLRRLAHRLRASAFCLRPLRDDDVRRFREIALDGVERRRPPNRKVIELLPIFSFASAFLLLQQRRLEYNLHK